MQCLSLTGVGEVITMSKVASNTNTMGGIDTRPNKNASRFYEGSNFYTRAGSLFSRPGTVLIDSNFEGDVVAMIQAPLPGHDTVLIVQVGYGLYHLVDDTWTLKYTLTSDTHVKSCRFINKIIMVNGTDRIIYDIENDSYETLVVSGEEEIPELEYVTAWKFRAFGWSPNTADSHMLKFCGYDGDDMIDPKVWPPSFTLNIGGSAGSPIFNAFPAGNHLLVLTETTYTPVYGNTEDDFEVGTSGQTNVLRPGVAEEINGLVLWLGKNINGELNVNLYSGTEPIDISGPIQDYLPSIDLETVFTKAFLNQFWVISPDTDETRVYIYDTSEAEWFIYDFPFKIVSGTVFGEYLKDDYVYLGSSPKVIKLDPEASTDIDDNVIMTSFTWGPINRDSRTLKPKSVHIIAEPETSFKLYVKQIVDDNPEPISVAVPFISSKPVKQITETVRASRDKGQNLSYCFYTGDKINRLNGLTTVYKQRGLK